MRDEKSERLNILLVMSPDCPGFQGILACLETFSIDLAVVSDCRGIRRQLEATNPSVVVTGVTLPDGNWSDVLDLIVRSETGASLIVYSQELNERLRSEVIARGVYDLISGPANPVQLRRCIEEAHQSRKALPPEFVDRRSLNL